MSDQVNQPNEPMQTPPTHSIDEMESGSSAPLAAPIPMTPVRAPERIMTMDALRGVALFGILIVNIRFFAEGMRNDEVNPWTWAPLTDNLAYMFFRFFGVYKFVTLFSLLFGMGLALQSEKADSRNRPFAGFYSWRLLILLGFGMIHGIVFWYGDILTMYAILGLVAILFRHASSRVLITTATVMFLIPLATLPAMVALEMGDEAMQSDAAPATKHLLQEVSPIAESDPLGVSRAHNPGAPIDLDRVIDEFFLIEIELYGKGPFHLSILHRGIYYIFFCNIGLGFLLMFWRCTAMFLVGIAIIRSGFMTQLKENRRVLLWFVLGAMPLGMAIEAYGEFLLWSQETTFWARTMIQITIYAGSLGLSLGYFGIVSLLSLTAIGQWILAPFAATGRMALTNYIGQSIMCGLIFYSYGLGMIGQIRFPYVLLIAFGIFSLQLMFSPIWLRFFQFGPLEWVWRSLTYRKMQPMLSNRSAAMGGDR